MDKIELEVFRLVQSYSSSNVYILLLSEKNGNKKLPIVIGEHEARSIAMILEKVKFIRPLTHELVKDIMTSFHINLSEIVITSFSEGVFYSKLFLSNGAESVELDARTSDAVTLALKFNSPIYVTSQVLETAGSVFQKEDHQEETATEPAPEFSIEDLQVLLKEAEEKEEYEKASKIMQEIEKKRKEQASKS